MMSAIAARSQYADTVICFGSAKNALLYFDYIIPINWFFEQVEHVLDSNADNLDSAFDGMPRFEEICPPGLVRNRRFRKSYARLSKRASLLTLKKERTDDGLPPWDSDDEMWTVFSKKQYDNIERDWNVMFKSFLREYGLQKAPFDYLDIEATSPSTSNPQVTLSMAGLKIIDPSQCPWELIRDFRRDSTSRAVLRRLRLFAFDKYDGRDIAFVEDDLMARIEDYERVVRIWGLETTEATINTLTDSKAAIGGMAGALIAIMTGHPGVSAAAALAAGTLTLGKISVTLAKRDLILQAVSVENPVSYISTAKRFLS